MDREIARIPRLLDAAEKVGVVPHLAAGDLLAANVVLAGGHEPHLRREIVEAAHVVATLRDSVKRRTTLSP